MTSKRLWITDFVLIPLVANIAPPPPLAGLTTLSAATENGLDISDALEAALASAPVQRTVPGQSASRYDQSTTIVLPATPNGEPYVVTRSILIPRSKNITLTAEAPRAARIRSITPDTPVFISEGGSAPGKATFRIHAFENLVFHCGGLLIEGGARGRTLVDGCAFHGIPGWAIDTAGPGVVGLRVTNCEFSETPGGGVRVGYSESDNCFIGDGSIFVRMGGVGIELRTPSALVRNAYFESKLIGSGMEPYIRIADSRDSKGRITIPRYTGGNCRIMECRFGGEMGAELHGPPKYAIELRPDRATSIRNVDISHNWFDGWLGANPDAHPADSGHAAISVGTRVHLCTVVGNYFRSQQYASKAVIDNSAAAPGVNSFFGNAVDTGGAAAATPDQILTNPNPNLDGWAILP